MSGNVKPYSTILHNTNWLLKILRSLNSIKLRFKKKKKKTIKTLVARWNSQKDYQRWKLSSNWNLPQYTNQSATDNSNGSDGKPWNQKWTRKNHNDRSLSIDFRRKKHEIPGICDQNPKKNPDLKQEGKKKYGIKVNQSISWRKTWNWKRRRGRKRT